MIQLRTILEISDNTGAQKGQCLKVYNKSNKNIGTIGSIFLVSIKKVKNKNKSKKIYKKELHKAIFGKQNWR
jgi:ribosomal protein L14